MHIILIEMGRYSHPLYKFFVYSTGKFTVTTAKKKDFVPTTFRIIIVCYKDYPSTFLLSDTVFFIQAVFTLNVFLVFCCLSVDSILYLISLMDLLVPISKYVVVLKIPCWTARLLLGRHWFSRGDNFPSYPLVQSIFI